MSPKRALVVFEVPLFLFVVFLFLPEVIFFLLRIAFVFLDFEAMMSSPLCANCLKMLLYKIILNELYNKNYAVTIRMNTPSQRNDGFPFLIRFLEHKHNASPI